METGGVVNLRIKHLQKHDQNENCPDAEFSLSRDAPLRALWRAILDSGFESPVSLTSGTETWFPDTQKAVLEPYDLIPIAETSCDDTSAIGINESLLVFANRRYGEQIRLNIDESSSSQGGLCECLQESRGLKVTFLRTTRMPDDDKLHQLPAALGTFPLHNVSDYAARLSHNMVNEGGVFMPMWQREAMWMSFESPTSMRYALRISVGRINAVSGKSMDEVADDGTHTTQDYVIVPGQQWLDGICVGQGVVRQFVAMPLGSGYTVEGQKTGEEKHGGLQLEIIPSFQPNLRSWTDGDIHILPSSLTDLNPLSIHLLLENRTPKQLGYTAGKSLRAYPSPAYKRGPCVLADLLGSNAKEVSLSAVYPAPSSWASGEYAPVGLSRPSSVRTSTRSTSFTHAGMVGTYQEGALCADEITAPGAAETITTHQLRTMGLAAGGKLMQDIYKDHNSAEIWNPAASKLVNIHILDPKSCEAVTHIVPPPPLMDATTYANSGYSLFVVEEMPDERLEGGDFETVESVSAMDKQKVVQGEQSLDPTKPTRCRCGVRLCDCVVRPCGHQFCNVCVKELDPSRNISWSSAEPPVKTGWNCPACKTSVAYVAGFSAPMNLPGEESVKTKVPVNVLEVLDGRLQFKSVQKSRM